MERRKEKILKKAWMDISRKEKNYEKIESMLMIIMEKEKKMQKKKIWRECRLIIMYN